MSDLESLQYRFETTAFPDTTIDVIGVRLVEALNEPYGMELELQLHDRDADVTQMLGKDCVLTIDRPPLSRRVCGVMRTVREGGDAWENELSVHVVVVPALWMLGLRRNTRMFQNQSVPAILKTVLGESLGPYNRSFQLELDGSYPTREYCLQYQESDLAFVHRLMEEEGISYAFDHEGETEVMVLRDQNAAFAKVPTVEEGMVEFHPDNLYRRSIEPVHSFEIDHRNTTTAVALRDFDWTMSGHVVEDQQDGEDALGRVRESYEHGSGRSLSIWDYSQGVRRYQQNDAGIQKQVRREAHIVDGEVGRGIGRVIGFAPGLTFELSGHPTVGVDDEYLITRVVHVSRPAALSGGDPEAESYHNRFEAIPLAVTYRPKRRTPKPRIPSIQTALVTGPSGEEIHVDEHGRIKVQFHWDRENPHDDTSSCWIRCQQSWSGQGWGFWWVPRVGMEVVVQFVDGDPDRPLVTGCVYNGTNPTPYPLPDEKTKSTIKSNSSPGGDGFNEFRFEDKAGEEQIYTHAQRDYDEEVEHDHTTWVGNNQTNTVDVDQTQTIGNDQVEHVKNDQTMTVDANRTVHVKGNFDETVDGDETRTVNGSMTETIQSGETRTVNSGSTVTINGGGSRTVNGGSTEEINGSCSQTINGATSQTISATLSQTVQGGVTINTPATYAVTATGGFTLNCAGGGTVMAPGGWTVIAPGGQTQVDSIWDWTGGTWLKKAGISMGMFNFKFEMGNGAVGATMFKAETVGMALARTGMKMENSPLVIGQDNISVKQVLVRQLTAGLYCIT
jgi:type VI secretion system secreted protein VgrG